MRFAVEYEKEANYIEVTYENMSEDIFQEFAYTYADSEEQLIMFVADRIKLFSNHSEDELREMM